MKQWWTVPGAEGACLELRDVPTPSPGPGQVRVRVLGAGVNRGEIIGGRALRTDQPGARARPSGIEAVGIIEAIGDDVEGWSTGERVMARGSACHAEHVVLDVRALMPAPDNLSDAEAATIPNVFVTAHDALFSAARMQPGERILVSAASSGVGTAAIQLARAAGATVFATTRAAIKTQRLRALGADFVVDTTRANWGQEILDNGGPVHCVIDQVGGGLFEGLVRVMDILGRYVSVGRNGGPDAALDLDLLARQRLSLIGVTFRTRSNEESWACSERFARDWLNSLRDGTLRPVLDRTFPLDALPEAHEYMLGDTQIGKIVLMP